MQHSITEILICWSFILIVDLSVAAFFIRLGNGKNSRSSVDSDDNILYNKRNKVG
jgi:hypothetical protein